MQGLRAATGIYFKVVDSDDWVNAEAYKEVLETLRSFVMGNQTLDMLIITNFCVRGSRAQSTSASCSTARPCRNVSSAPGRMSKVFMLGQYILMHSVIYRTQC